MIHVIFNVVMSTDTLVNFFSSNKQSFIFPITLLKVCVM